jgi:hypothetical protein
MLVTMGGQWAYALPVANGDHFPGSDFADAGQR